MHAAGCSRCLPSPSSLRSATSPKGRGKGCSACQKGIAQKSLAEFAAAAANKIRSVFSGDMRVGKNTHRPANVRAGRKKRPRVRCSGPQSLQMRAQRSGSHLTVSPQSLALPLGEARGAQLIKKTSQSSRPQPRIRSDPFFPATCASEKTLIGPQTCEPDAKSGRECAAAGRNLFK